MFFTRQPETETQTLTLVRTQANTTGHNTQGTCSGLRGSCNTGGLSRWRANSARYYPKPSPEGPLRPKPDLLSQTGLAPKMSPPPISHTHTQSSRRTKVPFFDAQGYAPPLSSTCGVIELRGRAGTGSNHRLLKDIDVQFGSISTSKTSPTHVIQKLAFVQR